MNGLKSYKIPFKGAALGVHEYSFLIEDEFFTHFELSPIDKGTFDVMVRMDKKANMLDLEFNIKGFMSAPCDRCLSQIDIPIDDMKRIVVKYDDFGKEDTDEVMYIGSEEAILDVSELIYEFISICMPMSKTIDCEENNQKYCDKDVLQRYEKLAAEVDENEEEDRAEKLNVWDKLKDIKLN